MTGAWSDASGRPILSPSPGAINWLQAAQKVSPSPEILQRQIDELKKKLAGQSQLLVPKPLY